MTLRRKDSWDILVGRGLALVKGAAAGSAGTSRLCRVTVNPTQDGVIPIVEFAPGASRGGANGGGTNGSGVSDYGVGEYGASGHDTSSCSKDQLQHAQRLETVGRLAGTVGHDFNNLLTVINAYSDLLLQDMEPAHPMYKALSEIRKAGQTASTLIRQLMLLSRKEPAEFGELNLNRVITDVADMLGMAIGNNIRIRRILSPSLWQVRADPLEMQQVLMNLVVNARDAMPGGGNLRIETGNVEVRPGEEAVHYWVDPGEYVKLKVTDTGTGMTREVMARVFEPYFTTKEYGKGTGLGLSTVYGIVKRSGGSIRAISTPGEGSTFMIYLPRFEPGTTPAT